MKHSSFHMLGCILPILAIFLLPMIGFGNGVTLFVFIVLMFGCHLLMMGGHGHGDNPDHTSYQSQSGDHSHEHH